MSWLTVASLAEFVVAGLFLYTATLMDNDPTAAALVCLAAGMCAAIGALGLCVAFMTRSTA